MSLALFLMALCEARGLGPAWLHALGITLVLARLLHLAGLDALKPKSPVRIAGGLGTQLSMLGG